MTAQTAAIAAATLPQTNRHEAAQLATAQHAAMLAVLRGLDDSAWDRPTDCARWTVRDVVAHVVGSLADGAHLVTTVRHTIAGRRKHRELGPLDALNEAQVDDRRGWPAARLLEDFERLAPKAVRARRRVPGVVRRIKVPASMPMPPGTPMGYLFDVIYIRDVWMHRIDISRAVGQPFVADPADAKVVAQVIRDLGRRWQGPTVRLELSGEGSWLLGSGDPSTSVSTDAVEYCRLLSGRNARPTYTLTGDESVRQLLDAARIEF